MPRTFLCEAMRVRWILDELLCLQIPFRVTQAFCIFTIHYVSCDNKVRPDQDIILVILMMVEILCYAVVKFCSVGSLFGLILTWKWFQWKFYEWVQIIPMRVNLWWCWVGGGVDLHHSKFMIQIWMWVCLYTSWIICTWAKGVNNGHWLL